MENLIGPNSTCQRGLVKPYPVGKTRAFPAGRDKMATHDAVAKESDCRITSAEVDLKEA